MVLPLAQPEMQIDPGVNAPRTVSQLVKNNPIIAQLALSPLLPTIELLNRHSEGAQNTLGLVCLAVSCALVPLAFAAISKLANRDAHLMDKVDAKFEGIERERKATRTSAQKDLDNVHTLQRQLGQTTSPYGKAKLKQREEEAKRKLR